MPIRYHDKHYDFDGDVYTGDKLVFQRQRRGIPITYWRHWYRSAIQNVDALDVSIAVRHNLVDPDRVYVAYVSAANVLTVKSAIITARAEGMTWTTELTQANCAFCSLAFDGDFIRDPETVQTRVVFRTESLPWLFYSTTTGRLLAGVLGSTPEVLVGSNVTAMDAVRGVASKYGDIDQGLLVFYAYDGSVKYREYISGSWGDQQNISLSPATCTAIRAVRLFDWRIALHVRDWNGVLHEIFTKMEASGWNGTENFTMALSFSSEMFPVEYIEGSLEENISLDLVLESEILYALSPVMVTAYNIGVEIEYSYDDDFGYAVIVEWDERVFLTGDHSDSFKLVDEGATEYGCIDVEKIGDKMLMLYFQNFNNALGDLTLVYTLGTMMGDVVAVGSDSILFTPVGLIPFATEPPVPISVENIEGWYTP